MNFLFLFLTIIFSGTAFAEGRTERYSSVASDKKGQPTYLEKHVVTFVQQHVQKASTEYLDPNGQAIGRMSSDFSKMITIPDYEYSDLRNGSSHGIRIEGEKITLWQKNKDGKIKEKDFSKNKFSGETLIVGCQGLHYYLIDHLDLIKEKKSLPIAYFIPGKLDYYTFTLKLDREDEQYLYLTLSIDNVVLKLFTSSLKMKYSKADRRLIQYQGLSNITDAKDELQNVTIDYKYE